MNSSVSQFQSDSYFRSFLPCETSIKQTPSLGLTSIYENNKQENNSEDEGSVLSMLIMEGLQNERESIRKNKNSQILTEIYQKGLELQIQQNRQLQILIQMSICKGKQNNVQNKILKIEQEYSKIKSKASEIDKGKQNQYAFKKIESRMIAEKSPGNKIVKKIPNQKAQQSNIQLKSYLSQRQFGLKESPSNFSTNPSSKSSSKFNFFGKCLHEARLKTLEQRKKNVLQQISLSKKNILQTAAIIKRQVLLLKKQNQITNRLLEKHQTKRFQNVSITPNPRSCSQKIFEYRRVRLKSSSKVDISPKLSPGFFSYKNRAMRPSMFLKPKVPKANSKLKPYRSEHKFQSRRALFQTEQEQDIAFNNDYFESNPKQNRYLKGTVY